MTEENDLREFTLYEHLDELRSRVIKSFFSIIILFFIAFAFSTEVINFLKIPLLNVLPEGQKTIHFTGPMDVFNVSLKISLLSSLIFGCPVWMYQFWKFLEPALYPTEKKMTLPLIFSSVLLFFSGVVFCYYIVLPMTLGFLISYGSDIGTPLITITDYISLLVVLILGFGFMFESPLVLVMLAWSDLISVETLQKNRGVALVIILIVAAIFTPPDPVSQMAMALPLYFMYEISLLIIRVIKKGK